MYYNWHIYVKCSEGSFYGTDVITLVGRGNYVENVDIVDHLWIY